MIHCSLVIYTLTAGLAWGQVPQQAGRVPSDTGYLRDHSATRGFMLGRPVKAKPTPDGKAVLFLRAQARVPKLSLYEFDVATGRNRELLTPEQVLRGAEEKLTAEEKARRERMRVSVGGFTDYQLSEDGSLILLSLSGKLYVVERSSSKVQELKTAAGTIIDPKFSPDGKIVAYVRDYDVYVYDLAAQRERPVTTGGKELVTHGLAEFVAQEEMNRFSGYWWSSDSKYIVYEEADARGVEVWHVADPARPEEPPHPSFYPRPGKANVRVRLGVVSVPTRTDDANRETIWIRWDAERYEYLATVRWEKAAPLLLLVQNRDQTELVLLRADPTTGETASLLTERDAAWVNLDQSMPRWWNSPNFSGFLWATERNGGWQLNLCKPDGSDPTVLVGPAGPDFGFQSLVDFNPDSFELIFRASSDPTQAQLSRFKKNVELNQEFIEIVDSNKPPRLEDAVFAKDHSIYVLTTRSTVAMPQFTVHRRDGELIGKLPSVAENPPFLPRAEIVRVGGEPGFYCAVVRPREFDPKKRYPVVNHVYGGPGHNQVLASMGMWLLDQWLADQGFIVVSIDGRGTPGRGRDWERAIAKQFGNVPLADQVTALKILGERFPEMDLNRVGIVGWSFGGYMSALAVLKEPDVFKAAVAGAPVVDWLDYDTHYTERYLGVPDLAADPAGGPAYREASLLTYAAELKRPLLLVHGTADDNVYFRHTLKLCDALFRAGKEFELLPLSGSTHMVPDPVATEQLWSRIARFFQRHLGTR